MIKITGVTDLIMGSWDYSQTKKNLKDNNMGLELSDSALSYHGAKAVLGAVRFTTLGIAYGYAINTGAFNQLDSISVGLVAAFTAGHIVNGIIQYAPSLLKDEALSYKRFQGDILKDNEIFNKIKNQTELSVHTSYQLFMVGNKLATGNPFDKIVFKMKEQISLWKEKWNNEQLDQFNFISKGFLKLIKKSEMLSDILTKFVKDSPLKVETNNIIKIHGNIESKENEYFRAYIAEKYPEEQKVKKSCEERLAFLNQKAILAAYDIVRQQNVQLFFAKIVMDYNKGDIHSDLIKKFAELNNQTKIPEKGKNTYQEFEPYANISRMARKMMDNKKLYEPDVDVKKILKDINKEMVNANKIKIYSFNNIFYHTKKKIINKELEKQALGNTLRSDKKAIFSEIEIDNKSFNEIVKITDKKLNQEKKAAEKIQETKKNKI